MKALLFDFDGLIVDTESAIYESWRALYREAGQDLPPEVYLNCVGSTFGQFDPMRHLESLTGAAFDWERLNPEREQRVREQLAAQDALPGVRELVREARAEGVALAVASSSSRHWVGSWLERLGLLDHFHCLRCRDDVSRVKPDPELFLSAARALGVDPGDAVVLEDSVNGLRAAQAAGMACVVAPNAVTRVGRFEGAALVVNSLAEVSVQSLRARLATLPC